MYSFLDPIEGAVTMKRVWRLRAMGSLCRQWAAYNSADGSRLLAEAGYWEHLAAAELAAHFAACNSCGSSVSIQAEVANSNEAQWHSSDAAWSFGLTNGARVRPAANRSH
jgi:hypothetical protein